MAAAGLGVFALTLRILLIGMSVKVPAGAAGTAAGAGTDGAAVGAGAACQKGNTFHLIKIHEAPLD